MAVSTNLNKHIYVGNGTNKSWSVGFRLLQATDLKLYLTNTITSAVTQITTNYSISPTGGKYPCDTATVSYPVSGDAISSTYKLTLVRQVDITQTTVYPTNTALKPKVVEKDLDKSVMIDQQLNEELARCIKTPISDEGTLDTDEYLTQVLTAANAAQTAKTNAETAASNASASATLAANYAAEYPNFNSINEMKSENLIVGSRAKTFGYYSAGDGGGAEYVVVAAGTGTDDGGSYITLNNGLQAQLIIGSEVSIKAFGAKTDTGFDNQPIIKNMINCQVAYSFSATTIKKLFNIIVPIGVFEVHSPILLSPFITIRGQGNHIQTTTGTNTPSGSVIKAVGDFTQKAIIDNAPYYSDGARKSVLYDSPANLYDNGLYNPCGNVTIENLLIKGDDSYNVTNCPFEAIHLCGASGSLVKNVYTQNTIQGISMVASWQFELTHNKHEIYWIGGIYSGNTQGYARDNYYCRTVPQRTTAWSDVSGRPFLTELGSSGTSYLKQKAFGIINIRGGVKFDTNDIEAIDNGFGIDYKQNDWAMYVTNTYMEKITGSAYVIDTANSFDIQLGTCATVTNLFDIKLTASDSHGTSIPRINIISNQGTEFIQERVTNVGTVTSDNALASIHMINFHEALQPATNYVSWDTTKLNVRGINFLGGTGADTGINLFQTYDNTAIAGAGTLNFLPFYSRTMTQNPATDRDSAGISVSMDSGINPDNRGSWQIANRDYFGLCMRIRFAGGGWSSWYQLQETRNGTTANRSSVCPVPVVGQLYYDTTLNKPIWWNGTVWKDATGTTV